MFVITKGKGFSIKFSNGWRVSVQFGPCNYCDNHDAPFGRDPAQAERECGAKGSTTAETAVIRPDGEMIEVPWDKGDRVQGYQTPEMVLKTLAWAAKQKPGAPQ